MSFTHGPEQPILTYGLSPNIESSKAAWPLIRIKSSRVTTIGLAMWGICLGEHLEAIDTLLPCIGWMDVIDGIVCTMDGALGLAKTIAAYQGVVAVKGMLQITSATYV